MLEANCGATLTRAGEDLILAACQIHLDPPPKERWECVEYFFEAEKNYLPRQRFGSVQVGEVSVCLAGAMFIEGDGGSGENGYLL